MKMQDNSYHNERLHMNVQKAVSNGMAKVGNYTREGKNVLKKEDSETEFTVRLHFMESKKDNNVLEEIQKILTEAYIKNLTFKGGK